MKTSHIAIIAAALFSAPVLAQSGYTGPGGIAQRVEQEKTAAGYVGPGAATVITTAADALQAADDTHVVLQGHIVRRIKKERYEFKDSTGTIQVEIDDEDWPPQPVSDKTLVKLTGEVDRNWRGVEVDVDFVEIIRQ